VDLLQRADLHEDGDAVTDPRAADEQFKPSYFAKRGQPCCSRWGKSEIEWMALAYVQALANDGDTWKKLTREQTHNLLSDEQKRAVHGLLNDDYYEHWFKLVSAQITDAHGASGVGGFWSTPWAT
jgi:hypothetical protein